MQKRTYIERQVRIVIEGEDIIPYKNFILNSLNKLDPDNSILFYPKTGKMVGIILNSKVKRINKIFKDKGLRIKAIVKPQSKSLKEKINN